jgi:hypothetical protein
MDALYDDPVGNEGPFFRRSADGSEVRKRIDQRCYLITQKIGRTVIQ